MTNRTYKYLKARQQRRAKQYEFNRKHKARVEITTLTHHALQPYVKELEKRAGVHREEDNYSNMSFFEKIHYHLTNNNDQRRTNI